MPDFTEKAEFEDVVSLRKTELALYVALADGRKIWVPQSQIDDASEVWQPNQTGTLIVSEWWAIEKGLV